MRRILLLGISILLIVVGLFILFKVVLSLKPKGQGALQVTANIKASVSLNGKVLGSTPFCKCAQNETIQEGEYTLIITPDDRSQNPFTMRIKIEPNVLTAIERTFLPGALASAYILNLEKISSPEPQLLITSIPDGALITIDSIDKGTTPYLSKKISASEHEVIIQKQGFEKKTIKLRAVPAYKLTAQVLLGTAVPAGETSPTISPSPQLSPTPTASPSPLIISTVIISSTPNGFLRVRESPSTASTEIGRVLPGESYPLISEQIGWYKIKLKNGSEGWVSSSYSKKSEN